MQNLKEAIRLAGRFTDHKDIRYLLEYATEAETEGYIRGKMHGLPGGFESMNFDPRFDDSRAAIRLLKLPELAVYRQALLLVEHALSPVPGHERGIVEIKIQSRFYQDIDFETKLPILDQNGQPVGLNVDYRYCYVRFVARRGDADHKRKKQMSIYADSGMGRGGSGGVVARALDDNMITESDVLDAWHAYREPDEPIIKMSKNYERFIDQCRVLVGVESRIDDE
jgi:hypothetical protein